MHSFSTFLKSTMGRYYILALFLYFIILLTFIRHNFHGLCPDETAYYNIALKYKNLHFKEALNAYWSPLISWLMVPLQYIPIFAFREIMIVNFFSGLVLLFLTYKLSRRYQLEPIQEIFFLITMLGLAIFLQMPIFGADFLSATTFILYIFLITSQKNKERTYFYLLTVAGALLCAFAKSFFIFYLFIHLGTLIIWTWFNQKNEPSVYLTNLVKIAIVYLLGIALWSGLLSWKYEKFTINSSGAYNLSLISPQGYLKHYSATSGLIAPPDEYSVVHWVDPTYYPTQKRAIFKDKDSLLYQWGVINYNIRLALYSFSYFSYLKIAVLLFMFLPFFYSDKEDRKNIWIYFSSALLVVLSYTLLFIEERYLIGCHILLFIGVFFSYHCFYRQWLKKYFPSKWWHTGILLVIAISFCKNGFTQYQTWLSYHKEFQKSVPQEEEIAQLSFLKNKRIVNGPFDQRDLGLDYIAFRTGCQEFGNINVLQSSEQQYLDLKKHAIDYYFHQTYEDEPYNLTPPDFLSGKTPVFTSTSGRIKIYAMKPYMPYRSE